MPLSALLLLVLSALLHAAYYGFYKRSADRQVFAWWFLLVAVIIYSLKVLPKKQKSVIIYT
jgi:drug/metabolite transporter (DMT)-like permease